MKRLIFARTPSIIALFNALDSLETIAQRNRFWIDLVRWIRSGRLTGAKQHNELPQHARLREFLQQLAADEVLAERFSNLWADTMAETDCISLFCKTGLTSAHGFFGELSSRLVSTVLPIPPDERSLTELIARVFANRKDWKWLESTPPELVVEFCAVLSKTNREGTLRLLEGLRESLILLSADISANGLSSDVRARVAFSSVFDSPFYRLNRLMDQVASESAMNADTGEKLRLLKASLAEIESCRGMVSQAFEHLEHSGVSVQLVFMLESISQSLTRTEVILRVLLSKPTESDPGLMPWFLSDLLHEIHTGKTIRGLLKKNLHLVSRKVVERAGATGEHYIARTYSEYMQMFFSACGGGLVTVGTTLIKTAVTHARLAPFFEGLFASLNYAGSFVLLQLLHFTLATKQPSMTASTLAGKIKSFTEKNDAREIVEEVTTAARSQFIAVVGNIGTAVPVAFLFALLYRLFTGHEIYSPDYALHSIHALDPIGSLTLPLAALTGVYLWASSIVAGWFENWMVYRRIPEAIANHRTLGELFGAKTMQRLSAWFLNNASGFGGNVSLGIFLGFSPAIGQFFGIPSEVRHVTLSSASLTMAAASMRDTGIPWNELGRAMIGLFFVGILNFGVSFFLSLSVAARARNAGPGWFTRLSAAVAGNFLRHPLQFFFPPGK